uniref:NIPSNAP domain-containing protein n=1 Tax=Macrostomum lignano TaxID=282301 RepID=A0A1I8J194_9PLAT
MSSPKVYEFRYYQIAARFVVQFKQLAVQHVPHRARRSRLIGIWMTELGALNHVLHVWEYESLAHRKSVRDEMYTDTDWTEFLGQVGPMFQMMDNWLCRCVAGDASSRWPDKEFYQLSTLKFAPIESAKTAATDCIEVCSQRPGFKAAFESLVGKANRLYVVESAADPDDFLSQTN